MSDKERFFALIEEAERRAGVSAVELCEKFPVHCHLVQEDSSLDATEKAIVDGYKRSDLNGFLFIDNYGTGYISFSTLDGRRYEVKPKRVYDGRGIELREDRGEYYLLGHEIDSERTLEPRGLDMIFSELQTILIPHH